MATRAPLPFIDYSSRDWESIRESVIDYLKKKFPDDWTDFSESNLGVALIDVVSYAFEILSFSVDRAVNENFISTAQERESIIRLAGLLGYKLSSSTAASTSLVASSAVLDKLASPIFVAAGTVVPAGDLTFELDRDHTIVKNVQTGRWTTNGGVESAVARLSAIQGQTVSDSYVSNGNKFQVFRSARTQHIDQTSYVTVDGIRWQKVDSLVLGDPINISNQNIYEISLDKDDRLSAKFGDGVTGNIPNSGATIVVHQRIGGGSVGNIAANVINEEIACTAGGISAKLRVYNTPASGGTDRETIEHARVYAPAWGRTTDRAITHADYIALCNGFSDGSNGRVAKAGVVAQPTDGLSNVVTVYAWGEDAQGSLTQISDPLKTSLRTFLNDRKVITVYVSPIQDGENIPVDLNILISAYPGFDRQEIDRQAKIVLRTLFSSNQVRYENQLRLSWVHDYMLALPGIKSINIRSPKPSSITSPVREIETGTLPAQTGANVDQAIITAPAARVLNHYVNYNIVVNYTSTSVVRRVIASTATASPGSVTLTLSEIAGPSVISGATYTFRHPRKLAIDLPTPVAPTEAEVRNRRVVLHQPVGGVDDVERSIVAYDASTGLITVDRDYRTTPLAGTSAVITPDYLVSSTRALTLGTVVLEIEDAF